MWPDVVFLMRRSRSPAEWTLDSVWLTLPKLSDPAHKAVVARFFFHPLSIIRPLTYNGGGSGAQGCHHHVEGRRRVRHPRELGLGIKTGEEEDLDRWTDLWIDGQRVGLHNIRKTFDMGYCCCVLQKQYVYAPSDWPNVFIKVIHINRISIKKKKNL